MVDEKLQNIDKNYLILLKLFWNCITLFPLKFASISSKNNIPLSTISNSLIDVRRANLNLLYSPELIVSKETWFNSNITSSIPLESSFFFFIIIFALLKYKNLR